MRRSLTPRRGRVRVTSSAEELVVQCGVHAMPAASGATCHLDETMPSGRLVTDRQQGRDVRGSAMYRTRARVRLKEDLRSNGGCVILALEEASWPSTITAR